jgi:hypothetical protein
MRPRITVLIAATLALAPVSCTKAERPRGDRASSPAPQRTEIAWGEPKNGLQAGLSLNKSTYESGEAISISIKARNSGEEARDVNKWMGMWRLTFTGQGDGSRYRAVYEPLKAMRHLGESVVVPAGKEMALFSVAIEGTLWRFYSEGEGAPEITPALAPGNYAVRARGGAPGDFGVETGMVDIVVTPRKREWSLAFSHNEVPGNPGAGAPQKRIRFSCKSNGEYEARYSVHPINGGEPTEKVSREGKLNKEELARVAGWIQSSKIASAAYRRMELGGGGTESGFGGEVVYSEGETTKEIAFGSHGAYPADPALAQRYDSFSQLVYGMKMLAEAKARGR